MGRSIIIGRHRIGSEEPAYVIGEIGLNHNGDVEIAKQLIDIAADAGCQAVKFQKRTPDICVPEDQKSVMRDTPWGRMTYLEYRHRVEFDFDQYSEIDKYCKTKNIDWFASPWDTESVRFLEAFNPCCYKLASAVITDTSLLDAVVESKRPILMSTGGSTVQEIEAAVAKVPLDRLALLHTNSTYPAPNEQLNLRVMQTLSDRFNVPIGYSGHETGLAPTIAAVAMGASIIERHITLDRAMWGSDQAASVEPTGLKRLVRDIRVVEAAMGSPEKKVFDAEIKVMKKLRRVSDTI